MSVEMGAARSPMTKKRNLLISTKDDSSAMTIDVVDLIKTVMATRVGHILVSRVCYFELALVVARS
jgi:hypothetical protein